MKNLIYCMILLGPMAFAQYTHGAFEKKLLDLKCDTALVLKSSKIRDPICWSPDGKALGVKVQGHWMRLELDGLVLKRFKWRNDLDIAGPLVPAELKPLSEADRDAWICADQETSRKIRTQTDTIIELAKLDEGGVALRITPHGLPGGATKEIWRTQIEDAQALVLSHDQHWVAFICGLHGVVVMKLP